MNDLMSREEWIQRAMLAARVASSTGVASKPPKPDPDAALDAERANPEAREETSAQDFSDFSSSK